MTEASPLTPLGTRPRPQTKRKYGLVVVGGVRTREAVDEEPEEIEPDAVFIERDGTEHPAWLKRETAHLVEVRDNPYNASDLNAPTHWEIRYTADLIAAVQRPEYGPGVETTHDLDGVVPFGVRPEHAPGSRTYKRLDGRSIRTHRHRLVVRDTPHPKTGAARTHPDGSWTVEFIDSEPVKLPPGAPIPEVALKPESIEKHEEQRPDKLSAAFNSRRTF